MLFPRPNRVSNGQNMTRNPPIHKKAKLDDFLATLRRPQCFHPRRKAHTGLPLLLFNKGQELRDRDKIVWEKLVMVNLCGGELNGKPVWEKFGNPGYKNLVKLLLERASNVIPVSKKLVMINPFGKSLEKNVREQ